MLDLFPSAYIDNSLLTSVLIGVLVLWWLAERFGWPAVGLVVPGYLGAVLAVRPEAAMVIVAEAILTWLLAAGLGNALPRVAPMDRVFGRDRFFLIVLCSVVVRMLVEGRVLAELGLELADGWHSLGLVLVPLTANIFWKPGPIRGLPLLGLPVFITYALLRFVLLPLTNLDFADFQLTYEDLGWSFVDAPREYIMLLLGTLIASWTAVRFGWDFGGIIVCGLMAIAWLNPLELFATLVEVFVVVSVMRVLLEHTRLRRVNLAGLRPIVLAFSISYAVKWLIAWSTSGLWPGFAVGDLFGFGYLLSSIVAVRCWRYGRFGRVIAPALAISLLACVGGLSLGAAVAAVRPAQDMSSVNLTPEVEGPAKVAIVHRLTPGPERPEAIGPELYEALRAQRKGKSWEGRRVFVDAYDDGEVMHGEGGQGGVVWFRNSEAPVEVVVHGAWDHPALAEAGVTLAQHLNARVLLLDPTREVRKAVHVRGAAVLHVKAGSTTYLAVRRDLPASIDLEALTQLLPSLKTRIGKEDSAWPLTLTLAPEHRLRLGLRNFDLSVERDVPELWDADGSPRITDADPRGAMPTVDLALLDRGVMRPLMESQAGGGRLWLRLASAHAARIGYEVYEQGDLIGLAPADDTAPPRSTLLLRRGGEPFAIEVRGAGRHLEAVEVGSSWFEQLEAQALLVHDARADLDAEAIRRAGPWAPELVVLTVLARRTAGLGVMSVDVSREDEIPGASAILSMGRPLTDTEQVPTTLHLVQALVERAGGSVLRYDGALARQRFYDPSNPRRDAVQAAGGTYVTAYLSPTFRARWSPRMFGILAHAGLPFEEGDLSSLVRGEAGDRSNWADLEADLRYFGEHFHTGTLERIHMERPDAWVFLEPDDGLYYLVDTQDGERFVAPLALGQHDPDPAWNPGPPLPAVVKVP